MTAGSSHELHHMTISRSAERTRASAEAAKRGDD